MGLRISFLAEWEAYGGEPGVGLEPNYDAFYVVSS
jgi:hypothetical protein